MAAWGPLSSHPIVVADTRSVGEPAHAGQTDDAAATRASASASACHRNFGGGAGTAEAVPLAPATAKGEPLSKRVGPRARVRSHYCLASNAAVGTCRRAGAALTRERERRVSRLTSGHRDTPPGGSYGPPGAGAAAKGARLQAECPQGVSAYETNPCSATGCPIRWTPSRYRRTASRYLAARSRCLHPGQQQGRRWPSSSSSWVRRMRRSRVVSCLASSTQQMNSLRAKGVMSFQASSAVVLAISASRRSAGSVCTTPPGTRWPLTGQR
jgi:hypothetical protein